MSGECINTNGKSSSSGRLKEKQKNAIVRHYEEQWHSWDDVYEGCYDSEDTSFEVLKRRDIILSFIDEYAGDRELRTIDAGCGTGVLLCDILKRGHDAVGVDLSPKMIKASKKKADCLRSRKISCFLGDIESLPFKNQSFDVVICAGALSHQKEDHKSLEEIRRIMKTGGLLVITLPNAIKLRNLLDPFSYLIAFSRYLSKRLSYRQSGKAGATEFVRGGTFTVRKYLYHRLGSLFEAHGLKIKEIKGCGFGPFTFFRKPVFSVERTQDLSARIEGMTSYWAFRFLNCFANTFVLRIEKNG